MNNIVLVGFMGSGKTTVAKKLGELINYNVIDVDDEIEKGQEMSVTEIFNQFGEEKFRDLETEYLEKLLMKKNKVVATGGGSVLREENRNLMKKIGLVIFLHTEKDQLLSNLEGSTNRPLLQVDNYEEKIAEMLASRESAYMSAANVIIQTTGKSVEHIAKEIIKLI